MPIKRKNWTKIGALVGYVGVILFMLGWINSLTGVLDPQKYFLLTIVLLFAMFVYFQFLKD